MLKKKKRLEVNMKGKGAVLIVFIFPNFCNEHYYFSKSEKRQGCHYKRKGIKIKLLYSTERRRERKTPNAAEGGRSSGRRPSPPRDDVNHVIPPASLLPTGLTTLLPPGGAAERRSVAEASCAAAMVPRTRNHLRVFSRERGKACARGW